MRCRGLRLTDPPCQDSENRALRVSLQRARFMAPVIEHDGDIDGGAWAWAELQSCRGRAVRVYLVGAHKRPRRSLAPRTQGVASRNLSTAIRYKNPNVGSRLERADQCR